MKQSTRPPPTTSIHLRILSPFTSRQGFKIMVPSQATVHDLKTLLVSKGYYPVDEQILYLLSSLPSPQGSGLPKKRRLSSSSSSLLHKYGVPKEGAVLFVDYKNKASPEDGWVLEWTIFAVREVMGLSEIRNLVLKTALIKADVDNEDAEAIEFGPTFGYDTNLKKKKTEILEYLQHVVMESNFTVKFTIFTMSNFQEYDNETHYQGFIADHGHKHMYIMDPAMTKEGPGIYTPIISLELVIPFLEKSSWTWEFVVGSKAFQTDTGDVFCQSWSLWMMKKVLMDLVVKRREKIRKMSQIMVPTNPEKKFEILVRFYKECSHIPEFCQVLQEIYNELIKTRKEIVEGVDKNHHKEERAKFYGVSACSALSHLTPEDLVFDVEV